MLSAKNTYISMNVQVTKSAIARLVVGFTILLPIMITYLDYPLIVIVRNSKCFPTLT